MLKAVVFGASSQSVRYMCQMCGEIPDLVVIRSLDALPMPHNLARILNALAPQLVLLEASAGEQSADIAQGMLDFHPEIPLITFRMQPPERADWNPVSMGLVTLDIPFSGEEFQEALFRTLNRGSSNGAQGRLIAFLPSKGGSGATTMSLSVASMLAQRLGKRVLFLECDIHSGPVGAYLNLRPTYSIIDVMEDNNLLDLRSLSQLVAHHETLDILPSMGRRPTHRLSAWSCQRMLARARSSYDFVFCDLPDAVDEPFEPVLRVADQVILVTTSSEAAGFLAERRVSALGQLGVGDAKISLVVNRAHAGGRTLRNIRQVPVSVTIPNRPALWDVSPLSLARMSGGEIERQLTALAEICAGRPLAGARSRGKFSLASLWSSLTPGLDGSGRAGAKG